MRNFFKALALTVMLAAGVTAQELCRGCCEPTPITISGQVIDNENLARRGEVSVVLYTIAPKWSTETHLQVNAFGYFQGTSSTCYYTLAYPYLNAKGMKNHPNSALISSPVQLFGQLQMSTYQEFNVELVYFRPVLHYQRLD